MKRRITGFHQDDEQHWVADLDCGHAQHVRHDPPMQSRPWVLDARTRQEHVGTELDCRRCDEEDARMRGLCEDGVEEALSRPRRG